MGGKAAQAAFSQVKLDMPFWADAFRTLFEMFSLVKGRGEGSGDGGRDIDDGGLGKLDAG